MNDTPPPSNVDKAKMDSEVSNELDYVIGFLKKSKKNKNSDFVA